ncbi:GtrA family protein [Aurantimicrobium sp. MWH-Uga1]|uniref:GtrA family protein n=1 Tax=Aurantimicrobium sp. MWH-Uga1 TaxID=2079575 RepID=UPI000DED7697|nr:GtrA family protein [Aurantimicrobium sp. MWH-Uga1]AXE54967.1 GtrA-like protein [Aurantimicrobium sp. MWH-Uga1]
MSTSEQISAPAASPSLFTRLRLGLVGYFVKFGLVGLVGLVVDVSLFNLLSLSGASWWSEPLVAKFVSTSVAIVVNWLGNRYWTFRRDKRSDVAREFVEFVVASVAGMVVTLATLWFTHYVLGFDSLIADNISANIIGLGLGTLVRFALYRWWVWSVRR